MTNIYETKFVIPIRETVSFLQKRIPNILILSILQYSTPIQSDDEPPYFGQLHNTNHDIKSHYRWSYDITNDTFNIVKNDWWLAYNIFQKIANPPKSYYISILDKTDTIEPLVRKTRKYIYQKLDSATHYFIEERRVDDELLTYIIPNTDNNPPSILFFKNNSTHITRCGEIRVIPTFFEFYDSGIFNNHDFLSYASCKMVHDNRDNRAYYNKNSKITELDIKYCIYIPKLSDGIDEWLNTDKYNIMVFTKI